VIDVVTAVINRGGVTTMTTLTTEEQTTMAATGTAFEPKANTKANVAPRKPHVTPSKAKSAKKTTPAKKVAKVAKGAKTAKKPTGAREGSKTEKVLDLLKRSGGATAKELTMNGNHPDLGRSARLHYIGSERDLDFVAPLDVNNRVGRLQSSQARCSTRWWRNFRSVLTTGWADLSGSPKISEDLPAS
jgi:hypothetical protein